MRLVCWATCVIVGCTGGDNIVGSFDDGCWCSDVVIVVVGDEVWCGGCTISGVYPCMLDMVSCLLEWFVERGRHPWKLHGLV